MNIKTYILGGLYITRSIFRFANYFTNYLFSNNIINLSKYKYEKINECIYSSFHCVLVSLTASLSIKTSILDYSNIYINNIKNHIDNEFQYLTISICLSYFIIDLVNCLYHGKYLFIIHHIASIFLLLLTIYSFINNMNIGFYSMYLIFLLESNTFLLNIGFLLKEFNFHYSITCLSWILHLFLFVLFRLITIPKILFIYYYNESLNLYTLLHIPPFILILGGSFYWSYRQLLGINKYLKENCVI